MQETKKSYQIAFDKIDKSRKQPNYPPCEASGINRKKVVKQFLRKLPPSKTEPNFDLSDLLK